MFQQQQSVEENMSILTCASGEASANSSANRTETHEPPAKKKRNLPGNPGLMSCNLFSIQSLFNN